MTALLYHGPTAQEVMLAEPPKQGWFCIRPCYGLSEPIKIDDAREFVLAAQAPPALDRKVCLQISLDGAQDKTQDVLLKSLEEHDPNLVLLLSVGDIGTLLPTVRSRCHEQWCGGSFELDEDVLSCAQNILTHFKGGRIAEMLDPLRTKTFPPEMLLDALTSCTQGDLAVWERLRPLYSYQRVSYLDLMGALL